MQHHCIVFLRKIFTSKVFKNDSLTKIHFYSHSFSNPDIPEARFGDDKEKLKIKEKYLKKETITGFYENKDYFLHIEFQKVVVKNINDTFFQFHSFQLNLEI
ncbi:hypothetical protein BpHYR1_049749 [Brachionus plicatilis]|uniref:Uncharacterized protein n=1 Tax=Brachionus plicatilis TaxID=10195 RepID=A0A3M7Q6X5_BRAPC|nr:hypothetical protein BpHYR1_049749 [Brachionus plicatilis]